MKGGHVDMTEGMKREDWFLAVGPHVWGRGATREEAIKQARRPGGTARIQEVDHLPRGPRDVRGRDGAAVLAERCAEAGAGGAMSKVKGWAPDKLRIQFSVAIGLCRRDLNIGPFDKARPTWSELLEWSRGSGLFPEPLTREQCEY